MANKKKTPEDRLAEAESLKNAMDGRGNEITDTDLLSNPLFTAAVVERDYSGGKDNLDVIGHIPDSIPEPEIEKQVVNFNEIENQTSENGEYNEFGASVNGSQEQKKVYNEQMGEEEKKEQRVMSNNFSDSIIDGYKLIIDLIKNNSKRTKEGYQWKAIQGKFDMRTLSASVDLGEGVLLPFGEFIESYNEQIEIIMQLDPTKEKEMRDLLKRIAVKRGLGMSDEMRLTLLVAEDVLTKSVTMYNLNKTLKNIESFLFKQVQMGTASFGDTRPNQEQKPQQQKATTIENVEIKERGEE